MPRLCAVCSHEKRIEIDEALVSGKSVRAIALQYNLSKDSVFRHSQNHLPETLVKAQSVKETEWADGLIKRVETLISKAEGLLAYGEGEKKGADWASGLRELRKSLELLARVAGKLDTRPEVNIIASPQWVELRTIILQVIEPYPGAKEKLLKALNVTPE